MLLIFPPVAKPGEPPAGIAKLAGILAANAVPCTVLDANLEGLLFLLGQPLAAVDTWSRRADTHRDSNIAALRSPATYRSPGRYDRAVRDLDRLLASASGTGNAVVSLADYRDASLSPLRSADLLAAAERPERNPFYPYFSKRLSEVLHEEQTGMVGISLNYLSQALTTFAMIGFLRKRHPGLRLVLGGGLMTSWMKRPGWDDPFAGLVDHCVAGPGDGPLLDLLGVGPALRKRGTPDYTGFPRLTYLSPGFVLPYSGSSGCFWNQCSFCPEPAEGSPYLPVPPSSALADIAALVETTDPALLHLLDNAVSPALMNALTAEPPGVPWYGFARFGEELADPDFCRALKASGCAMLKLGLESGDQGVLDRLRKGISLGTASKALRNLHQAGIATYVYLLFGTPAEAEVEARATLGFAVRHAECISFLNLAVFNMPLRGGTADGPDQEPFFEGDLSLYTGFRHPRGWNRKAVRRFLDREFKKHPAIAAIVRRDPPVFTSNHAALFTNVMA